MYKTERLLLKTAKEISIEQLLDYYRDNKEFFKPFEPERSESFFTYRQQSIELANDIFYLEHHSALKLFICLRENERLIGILSFSQIILGPFKSCYIGYNLDEKKTGKGYMTEAINTGIEIMFKDFGLHRIEGNVMPSNRASIRILEKLGFEYEGTAKKYLSINGRWEDHMHYTLLNDLLDEKT